MQALRSLWCKGPCWTRRRRDQSTEALVADNPSELLPVIAGNPRSSSADLQIPPTAEHMSQPTPPPRRVISPQNIDVEAANAFHADHESFLTPTAIPSRQQEANMMSPSTPVVIPPTPVTATTKAERDRPLSEPKISLPTPSPLPSSPSTTPNSELDDPLWRQAQRRSSTILRRLSAHRRSNSLPANLPGTNFDTALDRRHEDDHTPFIPEKLMRGVEMLRVKRKENTRRNFWIDSSNTYVAWDSKRVSVDDIKAIRSKSDARHYREQFNIASSYESRWLTIVYTLGKKLKVLHLISPTVEDHDLWYKTLKKLRQYRKEVTGGLAFLRKITPERSLQVISRHWKEAGDNGQETTEVGFAEVERLCWKLNVHLSSNYLRQKFDQADSDRRGRLNFDQFQEFVRLLKEREEIVKLFKEYAANSPVMSISQFEGFLIKEQNVMYTPMELNKYYTKFSTKNIPGQASLEGMDVDGFLAYLLSKENRLLNAPELSDATVPAEKDSPRDMTHPLNEYFISSSHNTYLLGRQIVGESSIEGYIQVLQLGCRCVEIDCWDGPDGMPMVTHGYTLGTSIKFQDVVSVIEKFAFIVTPYPLILSMEIHCCTEQQLKMAVIFKETLGGQLLLEPLDDIEEGRLPSPEDLKYKILLKIKNTLEDVDETLSDSATNTSESETDSDTLSPTEEKRPNPPQRRSSGPQTPGKPPKISPVLSDMAIYTKAYKWQNFKRPESTQYNHVFSFSESKTKKHLKNIQTNHQFEKHNLRYLTRVYPSLTRITSKNFFPIPFWKQGVQMVALNWQTYDVGMQIHQAMFQGNGLHGYILKPPSLLASPHPLAPYESKACWIRLDIQVISGQQLPRPKDYKLGQAVDPYVQIGLVCPNGQDAHERTRAVRDNEFNPMWNERLSFEFHTSSREFIFVKFSLHNDDKPAANNLFASYCIRLQDLHQGYRHVPLRDLQGEQYIYSTLFVKINWTIQENVIERLSVGKPEKRMKSKFRPTKMEEASRSLTSIESSGSSNFSFGTDESARTERGENASTTELAKINEVSEAKE